MGLAILFSGQGSHHPGMFDLLKRYKKLTPYMETASRFTGLSFREIDDLSKEKVLKNKYDQTLLCTLSYALWQGLSPILPTPVLFAGFSLGELCCYASAGCIGFQKLLRLSKSRAALMAQASPQNIKVAAVIGVPLKELKNECERFNCYIMIISGPDHATVGGIAKNADALFQSLKKFSLLNIKNIQVNVLSHTPLMNDASKKFRGILQKTRFRNPAIPVLAGIDGRLIRTKNTAIETLASQINHTVRWETCMRNASERGANVFLEIGPGATLTHIAQDLIPGCHANAVDRFKTLNGIAAWIKKFV